MLESDIESKLGSSSLQFCREFSPTLTFLQRMKERLVLLILFIGIEVGPVNWFWKDFHLVGVGEWRCGE